MITADIVAVAAYLVCGSCGMNMRRPEHPSSNLPVLYWDRVVVDAVKYKVVCDMCGTENRVEWPNSAWASVAIV
jgi:hypothetical protein